MTFWWVAILMAVIAAVMLFWPMVREQRASGVALILLIPVVGILLYRGVGTPEGIGIIAQPSGSEASTQSIDPAANFDELVVALRERLEANPDDVEGWMLLGRSYKTLQQYDLALEAHRTALTLAPDDPFVQVELAESLIFTTGEAGISPQVRQLLERALNTEPQLQKGLWLMGILESQAGNDAEALAWWERLLPLLEPGSGVEQSVREQVGLARQRLGMTAPPTMEAEASSSGWTGVQASISLPDGVSEVPDGAVLFLVARDPAAPRPPLGAMRIADPVFPVTARLTDANSMMAQRPISSAAQVEILARLSLSGQPIAQPGDWESAPAVVTGEAPVELTLSAPTP